MAAIFKRYREDGSFQAWRASIRIKGHPVINKSFKKKNDADRWAQEVEGQIRMGIYNYGREKNRHKTLSELIDKYIEEVVRGRHKSASETIRQLEYFRKRIGSYSLIYITTELLMVEQAKLLKEKTIRGLPRNPNTVNRYMAILGGAFTYACKNLRWIDDHPCRNLLKLKITPKERRILSEEEEHRLLAACKESSSPYLYTIVLMAITTGARKGEILNLTWSSIDFEKQLAHIKDSKNGKPRRVGLVDAVIKELKDLQKLQSSICGLIFPSITGWGSANIRKSWQNALSRAGIENFVFHGLRHHFCTFGGQLGATGMQLRSQMGHSSSSMTDHYTHNDAQSTRFIGEAIEKRLKR